PLHSLSLHDALPIYTLNSSLGPSTTTPTSPATIPNQTEFMAGRMKRDELVGQVNVVTQREMGLPSPLHIAFGGAIRHERFEIERSEEHTSELQSLTN